MYGGNSNWRGPVWVPGQLPGDPPVRPLPRLLRRRVHRSSTRPAPENERTLLDIAQDLADRIVSIWLPDHDGHRPVYGGTERLQKDPAWRDNLLFFEYFHGDNGAGLGAMHQTGWTALVVDLILDPPAAHTPLGAADVTKPSRARAARTGRA